MLTAPSFGLADFTFNFQEHPSLVSRDCSSFAASIISYLSNKEGRLLPDKCLYLTGTSASGPPFFSLLCGLVYILVSIRKSLEYPFLNFAMILLEPYLNVSSNFLINCLLCFTQKRLSC